MKFSEYFCLYFCLLCPWLSFRSLLITSFHVFLGHPLAKLPLTLKVLHLLDQAVSSVLSRWPNHCSLLYCKYSFILINFSLILSFSAEILSSGLTLHIHLTFLSSFVSSLITSLSLTDQVSLLHSIILRAHAEYNLSFAHKGKPLLANKVTKYLNSHHSLQILVIALLNAPSLVIIVSQRQNFSTISRNWAFNSMPGQSAVLSVCWFAHVWDLYFISSFSLPLIPLHLLCNQHQQNWQMIALLPAPFL